MGDATRIRVYSAVTRLQRTLDREAEQRDAAKADERRTRARYARALKALGATNCVYVVRLERWVKIGTSMSLRGRLAELQNACPLPLRLIVAFPGSYGTERALHRRFQSQRTKGEWFEYRDEVRAWVEALLRIGTFEHVTRGTALRAAGYRCSEP